MQRRIPNGKGPRFSSKLSGSALGLLVGLPLATACLVAIVLAALNETGPLDNGYPMTEPVYDAPAYAANVSAPDDVDFDSAKFAADGETTVIPAQSVDESAGQPNGRPGVYPANEHVGVLTTPMSAQGTAANDGAISEVKGTEQGTVTGIALRDGSDISDQIWKDDTITTYNSYTTVEAIADSGGKLGTLDIPSIDLNAAIYKSDSGEMEAMSNGIAHFNITSSWDGNVGLCGHNWTESGNGAYFKNLNQVKKGDTLTYKTDLGSRTYTVTTITTVDQSDWSYLNRTDDNRITLVTCTFNDNSKRLVVQGVAQ